jgi:hypothetical protein
VLCYSRRHVQRENVFSNFPWQSQDRTPNEFLKIISCLFMEANLILQIKFVKMGKKIATP